MAGIIADIAQDIIQTPMVRFGILRYSLDDFAGSMFIRLKNLSVLASPSGHWIGFLSGLALSILLGVVFVYVIQFTGFRLIKVKGIIYGFMLWFLVYGGAHSALHFSSLQDYNPTHTIIQLFFHLLFGFILGIVVRKTDGLPFRKEP